MLYELSDIISYAENIAKQTDTPLLDNDEYWNVRLRRVIFFAAAFRENNSISNLGNFAAALHQVAVFLHGRYVSHSSRGPDFMKQYFNALKNAYECTYPEGEVEAPMSTVLHPTSSSSDSGAAEVLSVETQQDDLKEKNSDHASELNHFLESDQFKALQDYLDNTLADDNRSHSYLCGQISFHEDRKGNVLSQLITDIKSLASMEEVKGFLGQFYNEKNKMVGTIRKETYQDSRFDILNSGQNITTRFFSAFGKQTMTINLIDSLAMSIGVNLEQAAEAKPRSSNKANLG